MGTRSRTILQSLTAASALLASAGWAWTTNPVTVPSTVRDVEGNSDNLYPFNGDPMRYQQVIAASEFTAGPCQITRIALRPDAVAGAAFSETLTNVQITLSTTPKTPASLSKTFADNIGSDETVVSDGELALSSSFYRAGGGAQGFRHRHHAQVPRSPTTPPRATCCSTCGISPGARRLSSMPTNAPDSTSRVWSDDVDSPTARTDDPFPSVGLVIRFLFD